MADPELILCDTSMVGALDRAVARPERIAHWPQETRDRLEGSVLAISLITEAEVRAGWEYGGWGERRIAQAELRLRAYVSVPIDREAFAVWPKLDARSRQQGWTVSHNDLWIAATAISLGAALATCDRDHERIDDERLELMFLPMDPAG